MSDGKFTPGPWRVEDVAGWGICVRALKDKYIAWRLKSQADAHLIAAAPEMYEALKEIERHHVEQNRLKNRPEAKSHTLSVIRTALVKAEGQ